MSYDHDGVQNLLLQRMTADDFRLLQPHLEAVQLGLRDVLIKAHTRIEHVWFIEEGLGSVVAMAPDGEQVEIAHIGFEGMAGFSALLADTSIAKTLMQVPGSALRMTAIHLHAALDESPTLRRFLLRYAHVMMTGLAQTALTNSRYNLQERLARWLLMCNDRLGGPLIPVTHEFLSLMLGVRRAGVTEALQMLEGLRLIKATRGLIQIVDRQRLIDLAGGSYGVAEAEYERLVGAPV